MNILTFNYNLKSKLEHYIYDCLIWSDTKCNWILELSVTKKSKNSARNTELWGL